MLWVCLSSARTRKDKIKINGIELSTGKILEESLVQSSFYQTLGKKLTFQKDNNLKHKARRQRMCLIGPVTVLNLICLKMNGKT